MQIDIDTYTLDDWGRFRYYIMLYSTHARARICDTYDAAAHRTSAMLRRAHQLSCCDEYSGILTARSELSAHVRAPRLWASNRLAMCCAALSLSRSFAHRLPVRRGEITIQLGVLADASHLAHAGVVADAIHGT